MSTGDINTADPDMPGPDKTAPWLHVIGMGVKGLDGLTSAAVDLIGSAPFVIGPRRLLDALPPLDNGRDSQERVEWIPPFSAMLGQIEQRRGRPTVILASGDPNWFGIGSSLASRLGDAEYCLHPHVSSFQLAAARMHWPLQDVAKISLHGRPVASLARELYPGARILALTSNNETLARVARLLAVSGYQGSGILVLENLGSENERKISFSVPQALDADVNDFHVLAISCVPEPGKKPLPLVPGLPGSAFEHDGQITRQQVRAITISALSPFPGALLWDVGAGSGSIGIEWMRAVPRARAIAFEKNPARCANIEMNRERHGVSDLEVVAGPALENIACQPAPDAIFLGGGVADEKLFSALWHALSPGGRLVANGVTLDGQSALFRRHKIYGGEICSIAISFSDSIGSRALLRPGLPVVQWVVTKPPATGEEF